jgi:fucose permease
MTLGLLALACSCAGFAWIARPILYPWAFFFGTGIGASITAINLFVGRNYPERRAARLTMLSLAWSLGAMLAPLLASRLLAIGSWRTVYLTLAGAAALAVLVVGLTIRDREEAARDTAETAGLRNLRLVTLFAVFFFLEVGVESTFWAWITTYVLRATNTTVTLAAASAAIYWGGFLVVRCLSPLILLRLRPGRLLEFALFTALGAAVLLVAAASHLLLFVAILLLGAALAPIFPIALATFLDRARHSSDTRFIFALSGFGGVVFPWLVGAISSQAGSLRMGLVAGPVTLLAMIALRPALSVRESRR